QDTVKAAGDVARKHAQMVKQLVAPENSGEKSLEAFRGSLIVAQRLAEKDPGNTQWQDDLAETHSLMGDMLFQGGENANALREYQDALKIRQELAAAEHNTLYPQYSLALANARVSAACQRLSRPEEALAAARSSLGIFAALMSHWPANIALREGSHLG